MTTGISVKGTAGDSTLTVFSANVNLIRIDN
jgi:hypothetical protein